MLIDWGEESTVSEPFSVDVVICPVIAVQRKTYRLLENERSSRRASRWLGFRARNPSRRQIRSTLSATSMRLTNFFCKIRTRRMRRTGTIFRAGKISSGMPNKCWGVTDHSFENFRYAGYETLSYSLVLPESEPGSDRSSLPPRPTIKPLPTLSNKSNTLKNRKRPFRTVDNQATGGVCVRLSVPRLQHLFKQETHTGIFRYTNNLRLELAGELLKNTHLSLKEIRLRVGITSEFHFMRDFKEKFGETPSNYRRIYQNSRNGQQIAKTDSKKLLLFKTRVV